MYPDIMSDNKTVECTMNESEIYNKLEKLREGLDPTLERVSSVVKIELGGQIFEERVWSETYENSNLIVVLLEMEKTLCSKVYCLGLLVHPGGETEHLSNEQLWNIGIP